MKPTRLLDKRLLLVTGKGGVGKSTVAAALGLRASRRGLRTVVAEIGGRGDMLRMFGGGRAGRGEHEVAPGLFTVAIEPHQALAEYLADQLPVRALADLLGGSRTFGYLTAATPGLSELLCIGKVWELAQPRRRAGTGALPYDLVILDAPASGHGAALFAAPRTFARAAQVGPVARQGARINATLVDPSVTGVLVVSSPHEAAVTEALETRARLVGELGIDPVPVVVNALRGRRLARGDPARLRAVLDQAGTASERHAVGLALDEDGRVRAEQNQLRRLRRALGERPVQLPFIYTAELGPGDLERLGDRLEAVP